MKIIVKKDGKVISGCEFDSFACSARWFYNNGICHTATSSVIFEVSEETPTSEETPASEERKRKR